MTYQALARQWRPQNFGELIGQDYIIHALTQALTQQHLHHAYLFSGTRGIGKTTIARIFAKCLNCETGITATPCNSCLTCQEITEGRSVDVFEIDAASRTKVEDTRELLDNVQYAPVRSRYKIYIIDEVHMLSTHSFNALLKTLEEPPPHVIFLLATTDPERLPATVLSRCLQFHLKRINPHHIIQNLSKILDAMKFPYENEALALIANAAEGSMRDALGLMERALGFSTERLEATATQEMLGIISKADIAQLLSYIITRDIQTLLQTIQRYEENGIDWGSAFDQLLHLLHEISIYQLTQNEITKSTTISSLIAFAQQLSPEEVQLFYQIVILGKRDFALAPTPRVGFEMTMLRMIAFYPENNSLEKIPPSQITQTLSTKTSVTEFKSVENVSPVLPAKTEEFCDVQNNAFDNTAWINLIPQLNLQGATLALAEQCVFESADDKTITLALAESYSPLLSTRQQERLQETLNTYFNKKRRLIIAAKKINQITPNQQKQTERQARSEKAEQTLKQDDALQTFLHTFNAQCIPESVQIND